jgi:CheY-like chemotaxis protein
MAGDTTVAHCQSGVSTRERRPLHILVVDDYPGVAESMAILLRLLGYDVSAAQSGAAALRLAQVKQPDVALVDISMPGITGLDVVRQLREMFPDQPPFLIAITAHAFDEDRRRCLEAGFDLHLTKPADPNVVECVLLGLTGSLTPCETSAHLKD